MLNSTKPGKRRGPKSKAAGSEVVMHLDSALNAIAENLERCSRHSSEGKQDELEDVHQTMLVSGRQIRVLAYIAKSMKVNGTRAKAKLQKL